MKCDAYTLEVLTALHHIDILYLHLFKGCTDNVYFNLGGGWLFMVGKISRPEPFGGRQGITFNK